MERENHRNKKSFLTCHRVLFSVRFVNLVYNELYWTHLPIIKQELVIINAAVVVCTVPASAVSRFL